MPAAFHSMIVATVEGVVAELILESAAIFGAALPRRQQLKAEAVTHGRRITSRVEVEI